MEYPDMIKDIKALKKGERITFYTGHMAVDRNNDMTRALAAFSDEVSTMVEGGLVTTVQKKVGIHKFDHIAVGLNN